MRLCALRGALAASERAENWVLHDPRAWLGTAFHKVLEVAAQPDATGSAIERAWATAVAERAATAATHPLDSRYSAPDRWPGYFLVRQRAISSAQRALAAGDASRHRNARRGRASTERLLLARGGRLAGRPDRFDGRIITEYKSSIPDPSWSGAAAVLDSYQRQLRLYAVIVADALGHWPAAGRIVAASGQAIDVPLARAACEAEASAALDELDGLNRRLVAAAPAESLARPSERACGLCPFQALCPAFWPWLAAKGSRGLPDTAAAGVLDRVELGQDRDLYTAYLAVRQPFLAEGLQPLILRRRIHGDLTASPRGAFWRIVAARAKPDGRLRADLSTCAFDVDDLPDIVVAGASPSFAPLLTPGN
ncbi:MAG: PD-(D/E)XK nuclease family protein [Bauldia sp.]|nr:PD-(D/E)XK nuclease family protein [Bauldia sp.]